MFNYRNDTRSTVYITVAPGVRSNVAPGKTFVGPIGIRKRGIVPLGPVVVKPVPLESSEVSTMADYNAEEMVRLITATSNLSRLSEIEIFEQGGQNRIGVCKAIVKQRETLKRKTIYRG